MIWIKRRFSGVDYVPYFKRLESLLMANPTHYKELLMVSTKTDDPLTDDYYVGVPSKAHLIGFDGFERVNESDLPKKVDTFHFGDAIKEPFQSRFHFRDK